uniref:F-box domain-containing protein n=1 Tax=Leersia perrieri TaxID=77586 RepID=A0A0D9XUE9_9ORYZ
MAAAMPVPDDVAADILRRLPPRSLAAARCIDGNLSSVPTDHMDWWHVMDHCEGLLLCAVQEGRRLCVHNPATRRWAMLPASPSSVADSAGVYLAFDPAVSPHYEVFFIPGLPEKPHPPPPPKPPAKRHRQDEISEPFLLDNLFSSFEDVGDVELGVDDEEEPAMAAAETWEKDVLTPPSPSDDEIYWKKEWPPSPYKVEVFSSRTGRWEEREFVREEEEEGEMVITTVEDMKPENWLHRRGYGVFFQGALYVHSGGTSMTRFSLSNHKYHVIRTLTNNKYERRYLGKSKMGVSLGLIQDYQLSIWVLKESAGRMGWVLNYKHDLRAVANQVDAIGLFGDQINGPWILEEDNIHMRGNKDHVWDSDNDDFLDTEVCDEGHHFANLHILGFHPYKEIIFLGAPFRTAAYHLDSQKVQYLGYSRPKCYYRSPTNGIYESFVAWLALIDGRALLLPHLLPHSVHAVVINYIDHRRPHLFSRPKSAETTGGIDGNLSFMPDSRDGWVWWSVLDHCDGLLLCGVDSGRLLCVCNPATRRREMLPPRMGETCRTRFDGGAYLVFDPAVSLHYEVLLIPNLPEKPPPPPPAEAMWHRRQRPRLPRQEEIAGPFCLDNLFSSLEDDDVVELGVDEEEFQFQEYLVESPPTLPSHMDDDDSYNSMEWPPSPFRVEVFSSRTGQWEVREFVREPGEKVTTVEDMLPLGYAYNGPRRGYSVYWQGAVYVFIVKWHLSVWILHESAGQMVEWVLIYQHDLRPFAKQVRSLDNLTTGPWTIHGDYIDMHEHREFLPDQDFEWDSDNDDFLAIEAGDEDYDYAYFDILGFHPYKEVIFLHQSFRTVAYHLNSSKMQYLGYSRPECFYRNHTNGIYESFLYTPCMVMAAAMPVPDDLAADILRRLPPRTLAAARRVCKPWRDLVDGRARLLPHKAHGVVINYIDHYRPHLLVVVVDGGGSHRRNRREPGTEFRGT